MKMGATYIGEKIEERYHGKGTLTIINNEYVKEEYIGTFENGEIVKGIYRLFNKKQTDHYNFMIQELNKKILLAKNMSDPYRKKGTSPGPGYSGDLIYTHEIIEDEEPVIEYIGGFKNMLPYGSDCILNIIVYRYGRESIYKSSQPGIYEGIPERVLYRFIPKSDINYCNNGILIEYKSESDGRFYTSKIYDNTKLEKDFKELVEQAKSEGKLNQLFDYSEKKEINKS